MNVYDELRKELGKLRGENTCINTLLDAEKQTNKNKTVRNQLLQEKLKEQWDSSDKKSDRIKGLKRQLAEHEQILALEREASTKKGGRA